MPNRVIFGQRLRETRKGCGFTQAQLALKVKASRGTVVEWEGGRVPEHRYLMALAVTLDCSVGWLIGVKDTKDPPEWPTASERRLLALCRQRGPSTAEWLAKTLEEGDDVMDRAARGEPSRPS